MNWSVKRTSVIRLAGTLSILACIAVLSYVSLLKYKNARQHIEHTQDVNQQLEVVLSTLKDAETGQRGYLLTGDETYLEPFQLALTQHQQQINRLTDLTSDVPKQQRAITTLKPLVAEKLAELKQTINLRQHEGYTAALKVVKTNRGKQVMDRIRSVIAAMKFEEARLLVERRQQAEMRANQTTFTIISGVFLAALLSSSVVAGFYKTRRRLALLEDSLQDSQRVLQASEDRLTLAVEAVQLGTWDWNIETGAVILSAHCEELFGLEPGSFAGTYDAFAQLVHPADLEFLEQAFPSAIAKGNWKGDFRIIHSQGGIRWVASTGKFFYNQDNQAVRALGIVEDNTERKQAEDLLQQAKIVLEEQVAERTVELTQANNRLQCELFARTLVEQRLQRLATQQQVIIAERTAALERVQLLQTLTAAIAEAQDTNTALESVLKIVGEFQSWNYCEVWILDQEENALKCQTIWCSSHEEETHHHLSHLRTFTFPPGVGLPGRVWLSQQPEWRTDVSTEPEAIFPPGIKAGLGIPLVVDNQVVAVLVFFKFAAVQEDKQQIESLKTIATQLGLIIRRKQAEEALRLGEARLQLALAGSGDGLWDWNIPTGYVYLSSQWLTMLGYEEGDLPANISTWERLTHPDDKPRVMETLTTHLKDGSHPYGFDYRVLTKSGEWKWIGNYGKVVIRDEDGNPLRMTGTHKDISERKRAEEELRNLTTKLQRSNQELESFAFVASHDLKEPLRTVHSFCSLLQSKHRNSLNEKGQDYLERIQTATKRMQTLIDDLLSLSRVTTQGKAFMPVDLARVIREVISSLETQIQRTGGRVDVQDLPTVSADSAQLCQLFQNLISNALKFHRQEPPVVRIYSRLQPEGNTGTDRAFWQVFVQDNGIGFDEKYRERIFGTFERLHGRDEYEGTGIGLAICKKIAERHSGSIAAQSTEGQGSTFIITLPTSL